MNNISDYLSTNTLIIVEVETWPLQNSPGSLHFCPMLMSWAQIAQSQSKQLQPCNRLRIVYKINKTDRDNDDVIDCIPRHKEIEPHPADHFEMTNGGDDNQKDAAFWSQHEANDQYMYKHICTKCNDTFKIWQWHDGKCDICYTKESNDLKEDERVRLQNLSKPNNFWKLFN